MPTNMSLTCVIDWGTFADWRERVYTQHKAVRSISMIRKAETESSRLETEFYCSNQQDTRS